MYKRILLPLDGSGLAEQSLPHAVAHAESFGSRVFAEANRVDLIVMSKRGRSGPSRWLMGGVADRVVRGANVPVLLVRTVKPKS